MTGGEIDAGRSAAQRAAAMPRPGVVECAVYQSGRRRAGSLSLTEAGTREPGAGGFCWIALDHPDAGDVATAAEALALPALAVADVVEAHQRPKLRVHGDVLLVVLKPVHYVDSNEVVEVTETVILLGPGFVLTVRHGDTDVLRRVRDELDSGPSTDGEHPDLGATEVLYRVADRIVDGYQLAIECILDDVDEIEQQVFGAGDGDHSERIYKLKREVAEFRRAVTPLARVLERLAEDRCGPAANAAGHFRGVHDHLLRASEGVEGIDRLLSDVLAANVARVSMQQTRISLRQNEDMRKISAWAAIALVPTAVAGVYGMNFDHMPELRWTYGYPLVLALIGGMCFLLHRLFRRNDWL